MSPTFRLATATVGLGAGLALIAAGPALAWNRPDPAGHRASDLVDALVVAEPATMDGYDRDGSFPTWEDWDGDDCDERNDTLARDLDDETLDDDGCLVLSGTYTTEPYTGQTGRAFTRGGDYDHQLDIDHVVALGNVWISGGAGLDETTRTAIANDPLNLLATDPSSNRSKGDQAADEWLPGHDTCRYIATQAAVKYKYGLTVTEAEKATMGQVLADPDCADTPAPDITGTSAALFPDPVAWPASSTPSPAPGTPTPTPSTPDTPAPSAPAGTPTPSTPENPSPSASAGAGTPVSPSPSASADASASPTPSATAPAGGPGRLADTGAPALAAIGALLTAAGSGLLALLRRR